MSQEGQFLRGSSVWIKKSSQQGMPKSRKVTGQSLEFPYIIIEEPENMPVSDETIKSCEDIMAMFDLRTKYQSKVSQSLEWSMPEDPFTPSLLPAEGSVTYVDGVYHAFNAKGEELGNIISVSEFCDDYTKLNNVISSGPIKTFTYSRCKLLHSLFTAHQLLNSTREADATQDDPRDFDNIIKVDTHIHLAAAMTARHLLSFIKRKAVEDADRKVFIDRQKKELTLCEVFKLAGLSSSNFTLNMLDCHADTAFQRFDIFNSKYNPFGKSELREVFLKTGNFINGDYMSDITKELMRKMEKSVYQCSEWRISIYGKSQSEWIELAKWIVSHKLYSPNQRWLIQIPRIFFVYRATGDCKSFEDLITNIFKPLFDATLDPASHPEIDAFLNQVSGFDSVDDESRPEADFNKNIAGIKPLDWNTNENPPYAYYLYYMYANVVSLNALRKARGLRTFSFRPHCGESGSINHLSSAYLLADGINHGIQLNNSTPLQYLYYLHQIGCAVSPLSNNKLFLNYTENPFHKLFARGLNVSLSTDDPLQFHLTETPLLEEYAIAAQRWHFSQTDLSEIARYSVLQSGFEHNVKQAWLGPNYNIFGVAGNDVAYSNIPDIRIAYREQCYTKEFSKIKSWAAAKKVGVHQGDAINNANAMKLYQKLSINTPTGKIDLTPETRKAVGNLVYSLQIHDKYTQAQILSDKRNTNYSDFRILLQKGSFVPYYSFTKEDGVKFMSNDPIIPVMLIQDFFRDYDRLIEISVTGKTSGEASFRLKQGAHLFNFHLLLNGSLEKKVSQSTECDMYHIHTVDNLRCLDSSMLSRHLLKFIKNKVANHSNTVVFPAGCTGKDSKERTLGDVFQSNGVKLEHFTLDSLNVNASIHHSVSTKANPFGNTEMKICFLDWDNHFDGAFFGELMNQLIHKKFAKSPFHVAEFYVRIHGSSSRTLHNFAAWVKKNNLYSDQVSWILEIPLGSYSLLKENGIVFNYQDIMDNIFKPLFDVTMDPESDPDLHKLLQNVAIIAPTTNIGMHYSSERETLPKNWSFPENPSFEYQLFYIWNNLRTLNALRQLKGYSTFSLRPTTSERSHLFAAYLLAPAIAGGLLLDHQPYLQFLYFMKQIGVVMSPSYANVTTTPYEINPFFKFFSRGLKVSLATHNPVQLHVTTQALMEEYAISSQIWKLSVIDISEIALNSVQVSGFSNELKQKWLGPDWEKNPLPNKSNVPVVRTAFRQSWINFNLDFFTRVYQTYSKDQL